MSARRLPGPTPCMVCGAGPYASEQSLRHHLAFRHVLGDRDRAVLAAFALRPFSVPPEAVRQIVERTSA